MISESERRWPAEWTRHTACLILYPHNPFVFRSKCQPAREQVKRVAQAIAIQGNEPVILACHTKEDAESLRMELSDENITTLVCPSNDTWARDTAPTFIREKADVVGLDWEFNAYGGPADGCYWPCDLDQAIASTLCRQLSNQYSVAIESRKVSLVLEGGSIHTDGEGTVLTTAECLLHTNRNPTLGQPEIERLVLEALGCAKMIWLPLGLAADEDTNGHVDNLACFSRPGHVVLSWTDDKGGDPDNYERCRAAYKVLESQMDAQGRKLTVHKLILPPPMYYTEEEVQTLARDANGAAERVVGERLAASYINFYIANDAVIVPQFGVEPSDAQALETLQPLFPNRAIVGVPSREILLGGGNIHCITQQLPELASTENSNG